MSRKPAPIRNYKFSDAELKQVADKMLNLIDRDRVEFTDLGFSAAKETEYKTLLDLFSNMETDDLLESNKMLATQVKNEKRAVAEGLMRRITTMAQLCFKGNAAKIRAFGDLGLAHQTDDDIVRTARTIEIAATHYLPELIAEGISQQTIQQLQAAREALDIAIDEQDATVTNRDIATANRVNVSNELYALVSKYAEMGKLIWKSEREAKFNDYLLYGADKKQDEADPSDTSTSSLPPII